MATSSRQSAIFGVQNWQQIYQTFREADFKSYDYETLRKSFIDYLRTYYPETFNDYIESSEFIALLDIIAFMGQGLAFRNDLNTRENFIDTAERRDSVIKLANLVSYNPKRNIAGQGYLKVTNISTTENITDVNGINFLVKQVDLSMSATKDLAQAIGTSKPNTFVVLASVEDGLPNIHCYIAKELVANKGLNAGNVIRELGKYIDGNGGGQPFFASGKGKNANGIAEVLENAVSFVK